MKLNISNPTTGQQKTIEITDERKLAVLIDKRIAQDVDGSFLGSDFDGYIFRITGGNDKEGFPMKQGVLTSNRVRLLLDKDSGCYRPKRSGERKRRSVRGCIVSNDLVVVSMIVVKQGPGHIVGLTDCSVPRRLGPKRANNIRKLFNLRKTDDVKSYVIRKTIPNTKHPEKPARTVAPKIQRLITPIRLQRKRHLKVVKERRIKASREAAAEYAALLVKRHKEQQQRTVQVRLQRRSSSTTTEAKK